MKKGNSFTVFSFPVSKKKMEEQRAKNQGWWDRWDAGDRQSATYLVLPTIIRVVDGEDPQLADYRKPLPPIPVTS